MELYQSQGLRGGEGPSKSHSQGWTDQDERLAGNGATLHTVEPLYCGYLGDLEKCSI